MLYRMKKQKKFIDKFTPFVLMIIKNYNDKTLKIEL